MSVTEEAGGKLSVLLVEHDGEAASILGDWLEEEGFETLRCPGPSGPDYVCIGGRSLSCALEAVADIIVIDLRQASDVIMRGTPGWQLALRYYEHGKRLVALFDEDDPVRLRPEEAVSPVQRPIDRPAFIGAVKEMADRIRKQGGDRDQDHRGVRVDVRQRPHHRRGWLGGAH